MAALRSQARPHAQAADLFGAALGRCDNGIVVLDEQARVAFWNLWMAEASGVPVVAAQGRTLAELFPEAPLKRVEQAIGLALRSRQSSMLSRALNPRLLPLHRSDDPAQPIEHQAIVKAIDARGGLFCLIQIFDVTDALHRERFLRKQTADLTRLATQLSSSERAMRSMLEASPIGVAILSEGGVIRFANSRLATLFLADGSDIVGMAAEEFFTHPRNLIGRMTEHVECLEVRFRRRDGSQLWAQVSAEPTEFENAPAILCWIYDISDHKAAEANLTNERDRATELVRARTEFLAMVSHEIRTPLNGILGTVRMLDETPLDGTQHSYLETIRYSGDALLTILNDVLDISKLEAGQIRLDKQPFDMALLVDNLVLLMSDRAAEKGLELRTEIDAGIHNQVISDGGRIRQILLNLIGNAIKFTDRGSVTVRVEQLDCSETSVRLRLSVIDSGIGIPRDACEQLFTEFYQVDTAAARRLGGTGLGLAISKRIVEAMGGAIGVESTPDLGSTFWFTLSFARGPGRQAPSRMVTAPRRSARACNILLVEDNEINQKVALNLLGRDGHNVTIADNGLQAVSLVGAGDFDLVLMDIQLPEMDGIEATRAIRGLEDDQRAGIPIVALTANAMPGDAQRYLDTGMADVLTKPIDPDRLARVIERIADDRHLARPQAESAVHIDATMIESLRATIGADKVDELIELFATTSKTTVEEIVEAAAQGTPDRCAALAHRLRGGALNLGLTTVSEAAAEIEAAITRGSDTQAVEKLIGALDEACRATLDVLADGPA